MPDYLLASDWKKVLGSSPPSEAATLTKKLEKYASDKGKDDTELEIDHLTEINELALSLKRKLKDDKILSHLDKMAKDAQETKKKVEADAAKEEAAAAKAGKDIVLVKMLAKAKMLGREKPYYFVLAMGSMGGLVIAKMLSSTHKEKAREARTRNNGKKINGKLLMGRCYGDTGKVVLELGLKPEQSTKPPAGLAANLKKTIKKQTQGASTIKVLVRGGGVDLDEDTDTGDLNDFGKDDTDDTPESEEEAPQQNSQTVTKAPTGPPKGPPKSGVDSPAKRYETQFGQAERRLESIKRMAPGAVPALEKILNEAKEHGTAERYKEAFVALTTFKEQADIALRPKGAEIKTAQGRWETELAEIKTPYEKALTEDPKAETLRKMMDFAKGKADKQDFAGALAALKQLRGTLGVVTPKESTDVATDSVESAPSSMNAYKLRLNTLKARYDKIKDVPAGAGVKADMLKAVKAVASGDAGAATEALEALEFRLISAERAAGVGQEIAQEVGDVVPYRAALLKWQRCRTTVNDLVNKLITAVLSDEATKGLEKEYWEQIASGVPTLRDDVAAFDDKLDDAVNGFLTAKGPQKKAAMKNIKKAISSYRSALANPTFVAMADSGYGSFPVVEEIEAVLKEFDELLVRPLS